MTTPAPDPAAQPPPEENHGSAPQPVAAEPSPAPALPAGRARPPSVKPPPPPQKRWSGGDGARWKRFRRCVKLRIRHGWRALPSRGCMTGAGLCATRSGRRRRLTAQAEREASLKATRVAASADSAAHADTRRPPRRTADAHADPGAVGRGSQTAGSLSGVSGSIIFCTKWRGADSFRQQRARTTALDQAQLGSGCWPPLPWTTATPRRNRRRTCRSSPVSGNTTSRTGRPGGFAGGGRTSCWRRIATEQCPEITDFSRLTWTDEMAAGSRALPMGIGRGNRRRIDYGYAVAVICRRHSAGVRSERRPAPRRPHAGRTRPPLTQWGEARRNAPQFLLRSVTLTGTTIDEQSTTPLTSLTSAAWQSSGASAVVGRLESGKVILYQLARHSIYRREDATNSVYITPTGDAQQCANNTSPAIAIVDDDLYTATYSAAREYIIVCRVRNFTNGGKAIAVLKGFTGPVQTGTNALWFGHGRLWRGTASAGVWSWTLPTESVTALGGLQQLGRVTELPFNSATKPSFVPVGTNQFIVQWNGNVYRWTPGGDIDSLATEDKDSSRASGRPRMTGRKPRSISPALRRQSRTSTRTRPAWTTMATRWST